MNWFVSVVDDHTHPKVKSRSGDESHEFEIRLVNGFAHPRFCDQQRWSNLDKITEYRPSDIIIASYPKCGTTWTEQCVLLLLNDGNRDAVNPASKNTFKASEEKKCAGKIWLEASLEQEKNLPYHVPEMDYISLEDFKSINSIRVIKTHAPENSLLGCRGKGVRGLLEETPTGVKIIIVSRNPLDACVSSYYHGFNPHKNGWPFEAWSSVFLSGYFLFGCWFAWVKGWFAAYQQAPPGTALWLQFEDLKLNPKEKIREIAAFLELDATEELIDKVVEYSSLSEMKKQADEHGGDVLQHLRKGEIGDWTNHFSLSMAQQFVNKYKEEMSGIPLTYNLGNFNGETFSLDQKGTKLDMATVLAK
mmetsp:Transcript_2104/g.3309  ORF Transcript_2104/g.3309 Transcript_2104/m.3309 type:complete len:361 (-) Transcript_2104:162-1244(-)